MAEDMGDDFPEDFPCHGVIQDIMYFDGIVSTAGAYDDGSPDLRKEGYIRLNDIEAENNYIELSPVRPTQSQYETLESWLDNNSRQHHYVVICTEQFKDCVKYFYNEYITDDIIKKIKRYYSSGILNERRDKGLRSMTKKEICIQKMKKLFPKTIYDDKSWTFRSPNKEESIKVENELSKKIGYDRLTPTSIRVYWKEDTDYGDVDISLNEQVEDHLSTEELKTSRGTFKIYDGTWEDFKDEDDSDDWKFWFTHSYPENVPGWEVEKVYKIVYRDEPASVIAIIYKDYVGDKKINEDLIQSDSDEAFKKNVETEMKAGKPRKQALAIAYSIKEKNRLKKENLENRYSQFKEYPGDELFGKEVRFTDINNNILIGRVQGIGTGERMGWVWVHPYSKYNSTPQWERVEKVELVEANSNKSLSKDMSVEEIAKKHNVSIDDMKKQVKIGIEVEKEHTDDPKKAERIALDHLFEIPDYYDRLTKMEKDAKMKESLKEDDNTQVTTVVAVWDPVRKCHILPKEELEDWEW